MAFVLGATMGGLARCRGMGRLGRALARGLRGRGGMISLRDDHGRRSGRSLSCNRAHHGGGHQGGPEGHDRKGPLPCNHHGTPACLKC